MPENTYAVEWRKHDLVIWDNIAAHHGRGSVTLEGPIRTLRKQGLPMPTSDALDQGEDVPGGAVEQLGQAHGRAAVDGQHHAGDVLRRGRGEEHHRVGDSHASPERPVAVLRPTASVASSSPADAIDAVRIGVSIIPGITVFARIP